MKKIFVLLVAVFLFSATSAFAVNLELWDEATLGGKIQLHDLVLKTKHVDIGVEGGVRDFSNFDNSKASAFVMFVVDIKKVNILNRIFGWDTD